MSNWPKKKPTSKELNTIFSKLSFYNDNKMTHAVLLATVLFGQLQIKSAFLNSVTFEYLNSFFFGGDLYMCHDLISDVWKSSGIIPIIIYFVLICGGAYEYKRFRLYSKKAFEMNVILETYYPLHKYPNVKNISSLSGNYLRFGKRILENEDIATSGYGLISMLIFFL